MARSVACIRIRTRPLLREGTMNQPSIRTEEQQEFCVGPHCLCVRVRVRVCVYMYMPPREHIIQAYTRLFLTLAQICMASLTAP